MREPLLYLILGTLLCLPAAANDPFDKTQRHHTKPEHVQKQGQALEHSSQTRLLLKFRLSASFSNKKIGNLFYKPTSRFIWRTSVMSSPQKQSK